MVMMDQKYPDPQWERGACGGGIALQTHVFLCASLAIRANASFWPVPLNTRLFV